MTLDRHVKKIINRNRSKIPKRYNQIELSEYLFNDEVDWCISISNRSDGKSFNYINLALDLAIQLDVKFCLLSRTYMLRYAYQNLLYTIVSETNKDQEKLMFKRSDDYLTVLYNNKIIGVITDLNNATDLKYHSNFLKNFPLIIYDEFLAIEGDYLSDEFERLKTIYESIDRSSEPIPYLVYPKILLLGNAVNFSSPLLSELDLFNILERHPLNQVHIYDNIALEMRKNDSVNEVKNTRAFKSLDDPMNQARFEINNFNIPIAKLRNKIKLEGQKIVIKLEGNNYFIIYFTDEHILLSVKSNEEYYHFCTDLKDIKENVIYLRDTFFNDRQTLKYDKGLYLFENGYTKDYLSNTQYSLLNIEKLISLFNGRFNIKLDINENREKVYNDNYIEMTKKNIYERLFF